MELKQIQTDKILANFSQPREKFDQEKIKELSESILSNGLINPITIREDPQRKGKYMIVAGERRWQAHKLAKLKKVDAFVKKYENDVDWQIESLIENLQREDLTSVEKENYLLLIWKTGKFQNRLQLAKTIGITPQGVYDTLAAKESRDRLRVTPKITTRTLHDTSGLKDNDRKKLLKQIEKGKIKSEEVREMTRTIKKAPKEVKAALLDEKISVEQAERISKLKTEQQRKKAITEHKTLAMVDKGVERNIEHLETAKEKREFDKQLLQAGSWITSFRGSVTDFHSQSEKTLKVLLLCTKFIPFMDDKQKERLEIDLNRLVQISERVNQLSEQIQEKI